MAEQTPASVARERVPGCICTFIGEWDGHSGVVAHHSGSWPVWIDKSCPVHGASPAPDAAAPAPVWRYPVLTARGEAIERMARAMWNGKAWPSASGNAKAAEQLAEDALAALEAAAPTQGGGQLSGNTGELAEAVEIVTEWLAMAEAVPTQTHGAIRYPPISQGEIDAIALLAKGP